MKNLYLHIGCGKTGSSALQVWLANNVETLSQNGFHYPLFGGGKLDDYAITSGNGVHLISSIKNLKLPKMLDSVFKGRNENVIFSSEVFQNFQEEEAEYLNRVCEKKGIRVHIIAYVRDVYDIAYSSYLQLLKRHAFTGSFTDFSLSRNNLQQFAVISFFEAHFSFIDVIHYDSEKKTGIEKSFCQTLGLPTNVIPEMKKTVVNRSLTVRESQLMMLANKAYIQRFNEGGNHFSARISDFLIAVNPEVETEIYFSEEIQKHFDKQMSGRVNRINEKYLSPGKLKIFNPENKKIVNSIETLDAGLEDFVTALCDAFFKMNLKPDDIRLLKSQDANNEPINPRNPQLVEVLRTEAHKREHKSIKDAFILTSAALVFRPKGPVLLRHLERYSDKVKLSVDS